MKTVNALLYAVKYLLKKKLSASLEKDNEAIKNGAEITFSKYANIHVVECTRKDFSKEDKEVLEKYAEKKGMTKQETTYLRVDVDNIDPQVEGKVNAILEELEDSNDKTTRRVASKVVKG